MGEESEIDRRLARIDQIWADEASTRGNLLPQGLLDEYRASLASALSSRELMTWPPLPRRVRLGLWWEAKVTHIGCWLVQHKAGWAAELLWSRKMLGR